jgi:hypothetical protein
MQKAIAILGLGLLLACVPSIAAQHIGGLSEVATGEGTLISNRGEKSLLKAVAVFLRENGEAEIWLMTGNQNYYIAGRWLDHDLPSRTIDFEITRDTEGACATGCGAVLLQDGCVPLARLTFVLTKPDGCQLEAEFSAKSSKRCSPHRARDADGEARPRTTAESSVSYLSSSSVSYLPSSSKLPVKTNSIQREHKANTMVLNALRPFGFTRTSDQWQPTRGHAEEAFPGKRRSRRVQPGFYSVFSSC